MKTVQLGDVARIETGTTPSTKNPDYHGGDIPFVKPGDLDEQPKIISEAESFVTNLGAEQGRIIPKNGVMVCCIGSLGKLAIAGRDMITNQQINSVIFDEEKVDPKFGAYFLATQKKELEHLASSTTVAIVNKTNFSKLKIPLPSLSEQKAIVAKLDRAQRLIDIDKEMLAKYDKLIQSVFLEMFGDPVTNPKGWEMKSLKKLGDIQTGKTPSTKVEEYFEGDIPFVTPSDLGENSITPTRFLSKDGLDNSRKVRKGTTLVCCIGATIGKIGMTEKISGFNQQINSIEWNKDFVLDEVGYQGMRFFKDEIKSNAKSTTLPILKKSLFEDLKFPVFEKNLQEKFLDIYDRIKLQKGETEISLKKSEELFSALVQGAFG